MKRLLSFVLVCMILMFSISAMAQSLSGASNLSSPQVQTPADVQAPVSVQGKLMSIYSGAAEPGFIIVPTTAALVASALVPSKYKSNSQWLTVLVTLNAKCTSGSISTVVYVNGLPMYIECQNPVAATTPYFEGWKTYTRTWVFPPENLGGPAIPAGSTVELWAEGSGNASIGGIRNIIVQAVK